MEFTNLEKLNNKIIDWENKVDMENKGTQVVQLAKLKEELLELNLAILQDNLTAIKDAIGDVYISMISYKIAVSGMSATKYFLTNMKEDVIFNKQFNKLNILNINDKMKVDDIIDDLVIRIKHKKVPMTIQTMNYMLGVLKEIAKQYNFKLEDCIELAIETVRGRYYEWEGQYLVRYAV